MKLALQVILLAGLNMMPSGNSSEYSYSLSRIQGKMDGVYTSYHSNGKIKAKGMFFHNLRIGKWTLSDSLGKELISRHYSNGFQFTQSVRNESGRMLSSGPADSYKLERSPEGHYRYVAVKEEEVHMSKRLWRRIKKDESNKVFYDENRLFLAISEAISSGKLEVYASADDEFRQKLSREEGKKLCEMKSNDEVDFIVKEDWFYSKKRQMSETRIIGICPVLKAQGTNKNLFWVYYPDLRPIIALKKVPTSLTDPAITNLEDVFFFRNFNSVIFKVLTVKHIVDTSVMGEDEMQRYSEGIEVELIEREHEFWLIDNNK